MIGSAKWRLAQQLELRWWERYLKGRDPEDYLAWKREYWRGFLEPLWPELNLPEGGNVLDAGCGPAGVFTVLPGFKVTAIDPLLNEYDRRLEHFSRSDYPWVRFEAVTLESFHADRPFDVVFCLNAINHVSDLDAALDSLFKSVAAGGRLVLSVDCHRYGALKRLFRLVPGDALHPHQHSLDDYRSMVTALGGSVVACRLQKRTAVFDYYVLVITV